MLQSPGIGKPDLPSIQAPAPAPLPRRRTWRPSLGHRSRKTHKTLTENHPQRLPQASRATGRGCGAWLPPPPPRVDQPSAENPSIPRAPGSGRVPGRVGTPGCRARAASSMGPLQTEQERTKETGGKTIAGTRNEKMKCSAGQRPFKGLFILRQRGLYDCKETDLSKLDGGRRRRPSRSASWEEAGPAEGRHQGPC